MKLTKASDEIVAYTLSGDIYCPECLLEVMDVPILYRGSVEDNLNKIASDPSYPINRNDEHSFDSNIFPKVIFSSQLDSVGYFCASCEVML